MYQHVCKIIKHNLLTPLCAQPPALFTVPLTACTMGLRLQKICTLWLSLVIATKTDTDSQMVKFFTHSSIGAIVPHSHNLVSWSLSTCCISITITNDKYVQYDNYTCTVLIHAYKYVKTQQFNFCPNNNPFNLLVHAKTFEIVSCYGALMVQDASIIYTVTCMSELRTLQLKDGSQM